MKTFQCTNCGHQLQRPTQPYSCPQCGRQAVGLFRAVQPGTQPMPPTMPAGPGVPAGGTGISPAQPGIPMPPAQPTMPPAQPGVPATPAGAAPMQPGIPVYQPGVPVTQPGAPLSPPAMPTAPQPPMQPAAPQQQPIPQQPIPQQPPQRPIPQQPIPPAQPPAMQPAPPPPTASVPTAPAPPTMPARAPPTPAVPPQPPAAPQQPPPEFSRRRHGDVPAPQPPPPTQQPAAKKPTPPKPTTPPPARSKRQPAPSPKPKPARPVESKPKAVAAEPPAAKPVAKPEQAKPKPRPKPARPEQFAWAYPEEPPRGDATPLFGAPAVDATGRIFIHLHGKLVALEEKDGRPEVVWEYVTGSRAPGPAVVAPDGTLRLHCTDGTLHCLNFDGKQVYPPAPVGEPLGYAAPVADEDGNTWISAADGGLIKIDAEGRTSNVGRYFRSRQKFDAAGIIHRGVLYIGSEDGYIFAIELGDRKGKNRWNHAAEQGYTGWYIHSAPAITAEGNVVVAGRDEHLYGFAPNGKQLWKTSMPGQLLASPVIDRHGHVYVGVSQSRRGRQPHGLLLCMDGNSHKVRWQYDAAGPVESTPAIGDDDVIYLGDNTGVIHAVDFAGKRQWTARVGAAVRSAGTILAPGRVAFGLDDETLIVLKCSSQSLAAAGWPKIAKTLGQCGLV